MKLFNKIIGAFLLISFIAVSFNISQVNTILGFVNSEFVIDYCAPCQPLTDQVENRMRVKRIDQETVGAQDFCNCTKKVHDMFFKEHNTNQCESQSRYPKNYEIFTYWYQCLQYAQFNNLTRYINVTHSSCDFSSNMVAKFGNYTYKIGELKCKYLEYPDLPTYTPEWVYPFSHTNRYFSYDN